MPSVLLIDDEPSVSAAVAALLRREGVEVTCASDAMQALSHLRRSPPDLDLLDALMEEPRFEDLPVVVFSGRCDPGTVADARERGARDFIEKGTAWNQVRDRLLAQLRGTAVSDG